MPVDEGLDDQRNGDERLEGLRGAQRAGDSCLPC